MPGPQRLWAEQDVRLPGRGGEADQDAFDEIRDDLLVAEHEPEGDDGQAAFAAYVLRRGRAELALGLLARHSLPRGKARVVPFVARHRGDGRAVAQRGKIDELGQGRHYFRGLDASRHRTLITEIEPGSALSPTLVQYFAPVGFGNGTIGVDAAILALAPFAELVAFVLEAATLVRIVF